jgi:hypothetical protein
MAEGWGQRLAGLRDFLEDEVAPSAAAAAHIPQGAVVPLHTGLDWAELQWGPAGVAIRGVQYARLTSVHVLRNWQRFRGPFPTGAGVAARDALALPVPRLPVAAVRSEAGAAAAAGPTAAASRGVAAALDHDVDVTAYFKSASGRGTKRAYTPPAWAKLL